MVTLLKEADVGSRVIPSLQLLLAASLDVD